MNKWTKDFRIFQSGKASWFPELTDPAAWWPHCQNIFFPSAKKFRGRLNKLPDIFHQSPCDIVRSRLKITLRIDADDRFCIGGAEVHPIIIKFYLKTIFSVRRVI